VRSLQGLRIGFYCVVCSDNTVSGALYKFPGTDDLRKLEAPLLWTPVIQYVLSPDCARGTVPLAQSGEVTFTMSRGVMIMISRIVLADGSRSCNVVREVR
jgi:hypothetical protein